MVFQELDVPLDYVLAFGVWLLALPAILNGPVFLSLYPSNPTYIQY